MVGLAFFESYILVLSFVSKTIKWQTSLYLPIQLSHVHFLPISGCPTDKPLILDCSIIKGDIFYLTIPDCCQLLVYIAMETLTASKWSIGASGTRMFLLTKLSSNSYWHFNCLLNNAHLKRIFFRITPPPRSFAQCSNIVTSWTRIYLLTRLSFPMPYWQRFLHWLNGRYRRPFLLSTRLLSTRSLNHWL